MNTRRMASEYRLAKWARMMQERKENHESIKDYCQRTGVSRNTYHYWQRKVREAICEGLSVNSDEVMLPSAVAPGFALVKAAEPQESMEHHLFKGDGHLHVEIGKIKLRADSGYPLEKLTVLLREFVER